MRSLIALSLIGLLCYFAVSAPAQKPSYFIPNTFESNHLGISGEQIEHFFTTNSDSPIPGIYERLRAKGSLPRSDTCISQELCFKCWKRTEHPSDDQ